MNLRTKGSRRTLSVAHSCEESQVALGLCKARRAVRTIEDVRPHAVELLR